MTGQPSQQQLGQPFLPAFDVPQVVSRPNKSKRSRRSAEVPPSVHGGAASTAEKPTSSRMRMPSHTSLLLGLSLGPAFGDDDNSAPASGPLLLQSQWAEAQVPSQSGGKRDQHKKRGSRGVSIERSKVTKAARLPLGGSPSFGLNILGLGDALEVDSAFIYVDDALCQSPVPSIVITPPAVIVAHTPSRLARSESKAGSLLVLSFSGLGDVAEDTGSKLAPAPIPTDSPSVRSITSNLTMTAAASVNGTEVIIGESPSYDDPSLISPPRSMSPPPTARAGCAPGEWSQVSIFNSPPEVDSTVLPIIQQRMAEDQAFFTELALEIDVILSEYIYINSPTQAWIVGRRLTTLLLNAIYGHGFAKVPPTLRKMRQVGEEVLPGDWVETESERLLEKVLDHVVTGILVVLADPRSPFETPQSLAQLCCNLKVSLSSHHRSHISPEVEIPCLSPYSGMVSGQPSPPVEAQSPMASSREIGRLFEEIVLANLRDILKKGEDVRDRAHRLEVPLARKGNKKRWEMASSERIQAVADQQKIRKLAAKGLISGDDFLKLERRRAAKGNVRDQFADISVLRFVGELYRLSFIGLPDVQAWLERMLFDTVYPGVPSIYELGCACALITIIGPQLEAVADKEDRQAYVAYANRSTSRTFHPPARPIPETPIRTKEQQMSRNWRRPLRPDAPANHWIQCSPAAAIRSPSSPFSSTSTRTVSCGSGKLSLSSFGSLHSVQSSCSSNWSGSTPALSPPPSAKDEGNEARLTIAGCMDRLGELLKEDDAEEGVKEIIKSVLGLYSRGWVANSMPFTPIRMAI
ncbi:hypothetical protein A4X13_0g1082 [Tilletia indica]|uniref:MIF4G domain-containing protein n=1 Tax=Tilletia indica TaxID=43049 RepID=A0A8T8TFS1_9BASI|nr:hypothetical protein A4X13_0g1082 [Tilletia indica]